MYIKNMDSKKLKIIYLIVLGMKGVNYQSLQNKERERNGSRYLFVSVRGENSPVPLCEIFFFPYFPFSPVYATLEQ